MLDKKVADLINTQVNKEFYSAYAFIIFHLSFFIVFFYLGPKVA